MSSPIPSPSTPIDPNLSPARYAAAQRFLRDRVNYELLPAVPYRTQEFKLDRMRSLLSQLGDPQLRFPAVHVAGTKGKGSTTTMIGAILSAAGYRTGTFTSPHLDRIEQRMAIHGLPCPAEDFCRLTERLIPVVQAMDADRADQPDPSGHGPTYFEVITALAFLYFAEAPVDLAVLEVGLGGRLDSTNLCRPALTVITSISLDHMRQLGDTLEAIAQEKAGILKPGVPVVSGVLQPEPREVIRRVARRLQCPLRELGVDFHFDYAPPAHLELAPASGRLDIHGNVADTPYHYDNLSLRLLGSHQAANAAVAVAAVSQLQSAGWRIPEEAIRTGLAEATCSARVEVLSRRPTVIIDSAHNAASVIALLDTLDASFSVRRRWLLFATTREKDIPGMLSLLLAHFDEVLFTRYLENPRAVPPEDLAKMATAWTGRDYSICLDPIQAWNQVRASASPDDLICITGSFFIAGELHRVICAS